MSELPLEEELSSIFDRQLSAFKTLLLEECKNCATQRIDLLQRSKDSLRQEVVDLRKQVFGLKITDIDSALSPTEETCDKPVQDALQAPDSVEAGRSGRLRPDPALSATVQLGDLHLREDFWEYNASRPGHDGGMISHSGQDQEIEGNGPGNPSWLINPTGNKKLAWDVFGIPVLAWDLITIPMQVFGIENASSMVTMGWVTLIFWSIDIPICFTTGYFDNEGELIMDPARIVRHYIRGMFGLDLLIVGADWVSIIIEAVAGSAPGFLSNIAILRALRITRFARLMRLRKLKSKWQTVEDHLDSESILVCLNLINKVFIIFAVTHYIGCLFFLLGEQGITGYSTWLDTPYFQFKAIGRGGCGEAGTTCSIATAPWGYQYWTSVHWAITQFTPGSMHVQAQNIPERVFTIFCLLFGMIVFSAFIANVTQARIQLTKMFSKFERDMWLLRKYLRQNGISRELTVRMKRYVELVLIPKFHHMSAKDVILLPQLSERLREEMMTEIESHKLEVHPFFKELTKNKSAITKVCTTALLNIPVARGDVVFAAATNSKYMYFITSGCLDYLPHSSTDNDQVVLLAKGRWLCEATLWTQWITQGQLQSDIESSCLCVDGAKFRLTLSQNAMHAAYARNYAKNFLDALNDAWEASDMIPNDVQDQFTASSHAQAKGPARRKSTRAPEQNDSAAEAPDVNEPLVLGRTNLI